MTLSYDDVFYPESAFGGFSDIDGTVAFYTRINALVQPSFRILDFGCGRGSHIEDPVAFRRELRTFKGKVSTVIGVDVDANADCNSSLDEFRILTDEQHWPVEDSSVQLVFADSVLEHLPRPATLFSEARRVLVNGGYLCIRTSNMLSYVGIAARLVPDRLHHDVLKRVQRSRAKQDVFPTLYRCNTVSSIRSCMITGGFRAVVYGYEGEPSYLHFSKLAYGLGVAYRRLAPSVLWSAIFGFGQRQ